MLFRSLLVHTRSLRSRVPVTFTIRQTTSDSAAGAAGAAEVAAGGATTTAPAALTGGVTAADSTCCERPGIATAASASVETKRTLRVFMDSLCADDSATATPKKTAGRSPPFFPIKGAFDQNFTLKPIAYTRPKVSYTLGKVLPLLALVVPASLPTTGGFLSSKLTTDACTEKCESYL